MKSNIFIWICVCFMLVSGCHKEDDVDSPFLEMETQVIDIVNQERLKVGLHPLQMNESLMRSSGIRAKELKAKFSHTRPDGSSCFTVIEESLSYGAAGENIAAGQPDASSVMNSWMNSEGHRKNILSEKYTDIGVGCYKDENKLYWVQLFIGQ